MFCASFGEEKKEQNSESEYRMLHNPAFRNIGYIVEAEISFLVRWFRCCKLFYFACSLVLLFRRPKIFQTQKGLDLTEQSAVKYVFWQIEWLKSWTFTKRLNGQCGFWSIEGFVVRGRHWLPPGIGIRQILKNMCSSKSDYKMFSMHICYVIFGG